MKFSLTVFEKHVRGRKLCIYLRKCHFWTGVITFVIIFKGKISFLYICQIKGTRRTFLQE